MDMPNVVIERERYAYDLRGLAEGRFALRVVIGVRRVKVRGEIVPDWVLEIWASRSGAEDLVTPGPAQVGGRGVTPYWVLTDGDGVTPYLCPYDTPFFRILPSPRWTDALWRRLALRLAEYVGYDARSERRARLAPADADETSADIMLRADPAVTLPAGRRS